MNFAEDLSGSQVKLKILDVESGDLCTTSHKRIWRAPLKGFWRSFWARCRASSLASSCHLGTIYKSYESSSKVENAYSLSASIPSLDILVTRPSVFSKWRPIIFAASPVVFSILMQTSSPFFAESTGFPLLSIDDTAPMHMFSFESYTKAQTLSLTLLGTQIGAPTLNWPSSILTPTTIGSLLAKIQSGMMDIFAGKIATSLSSSCFRFFWSFRCFSNMSVRW